MKMRAYQDTVKPMYYFDATIASTTPHLAAMHTSILVAKSVYKAATYCRLLYWNPIHFSRFKFNSICYILLCFFHRILLSKVMPRYFAILAYEHFSAK